MVSLSISLVSTHHAVTNSSHGLRSTSVSEIPSPRSFAIDSLDFFEIEPTYVSHKSLKNSPTNPSANLFGSFSERIFTRVFFGDFWKPSLKNTSQSFVFILAIGEKDGRSTIPLPISTQASADDTMKASGQEIPKWVKRRAHLSPSIIASGSDNPESWWSHFSFVRKDEREGQSLVTAWPRDRAKAYPSQLDHVWE